MSLDEEDTVDDLLGMSANDPIEVKSVLEDSVEISAVTHRGRVRKKNEDQYAVVRRTRAGVVLASSLPSSDLTHPDRTAWLMCVADGLGGEVSGEVASATATKAMLEFASEMSSWVMQPTENLQLDIQKRVALYSQAIKRELRDKAKENAELDGMATTLTAAYIYGDSAVVVNVGDSRSYLVGASGIRQITRDHTVAQDLLDAGVPAESTRAYGNVLTRCFGTDGEPVPVDVFHVKLNVNDRILLCSDGLSDLVIDADIATVIAESKSTVDACETLVSAALLAGGRDNITVVLARMLESMRPHPLDALHAGIDSKSDSGAVTKV
ncbi:MAG: protein phosphatase 2C domain-containing protein [Rubripirellula sp.]|nr:protein phosphatase 2C domain-containing protein [Rubripirellula sp.]